MFELKAINRFEDLEASEKEGKQIIRKPGDIFIVNNPARARMLAGDNSRKIKYAEITKGIKNTLQKRLGLAKIMFGKPIDKKCK